MAKCCNDNLSKIFCNAYNKYYNTLYTNGEISKKETENLLVISYIRKLFINPRYINYRPILIKALRCIADRSCLLDSSELYGRLDIKIVGDKFVTVLMRDIYSVKIEETDPTVPLYVKDIKQSDITNWNSKLSLETDPIFSASPAATITEEDIDNWNNPSGGGELSDWNEADTSSLAYIKNKPTIPAAQVQSNWNESNTSSKAYILNKPTIPTVPTNVSAFNNDAGYLTQHQDIKTVNNTSLVGNGNIDLVPTETFNNFCPIIEDTRSQATDVNITGAAPFATLAGGQRIVLHFKYANTASPTLQLTLSGGTTTSAYPLYQNYNNGVNALTLQAMPAGSYGEFVFDSTNSRWVLIGKDFNTTYSNTSQADINNSAQGSRLIEPKLLRDNFYLKSEVNNICPIIEDTRSSAVATITGVAPFSTLVDGQRIMLHMAFVTANYSTLNLTLSNGTTTGDIDVMISLGSNSLSRLHANILRANGYYELVYDSSQWVVSGYDTNTTYSTMTQAQINAGTLSQALLVPPTLFHDNAYIIEETYSSGSLKANKFYDFGTVSSALTIPSLDATNDLVSNALNFYALRFIAGADNLSITFPTGVIVDDEPTINTGDYVEIMINKYGNNFYASIKVWQAQ